MKAFFPDNSFGEMLEEAVRNNTKTKQISIQFGSTDEEE